MFGTDFSPANWEAIQWGKSTLTKNLFSDTSLMHNTGLSLARFSDVSL